MSFTKTYPKRKDWRKPDPHRGHRTDHDHRPIGTCPWCQANRRHRMAKMMQKTKDQ